MCGDYKHVAILLAMHNPEHAAAKLRDRLERAGKMHIRWIGSNYVRCSESQSNPIQFDASAIHFLSNVTA